MVRHLTLNVERFWFREIVAGESFDPADPDLDANAAWRVPAEMSAEAVFGRCRAEIARERDHHRDFPRRPTRHVARRHLADMETVRPAGDRPPRDHGDGMPCRSFRRGARAHRRPPLDLVRPDQADCLPNRNLTAMKVARALGPPGSQRDGCARRMSRAGLRRPPTSPTSRRPAPPPFLLRQIDEPRRISSQGASAGTTRR